MVRATVLLTAGCGFKSCRAYVETKRTHYTPYWANVTACKVPVYKVMYTTNTKVRVDCPACKAAVRSGKKDSRG